MKGFVINPFDKTIEPIEILGTRGAIRTFLAAEELDEVEMEPGLVVFTDMDALLYDERAFFTILTDSPEAYPFTNKALVLGTRDSKVVSCQVSLAWLSARVKFLSLAELAGILRVMDGGEDEEDENV